MVFEVPYIPSDTAGSKASNIQVDQSWAVARSRDVLGNRRGDLRNREMNRYLSSFMCTMDSR